MAIKEQNLLSFLLRFEGIKDVRKDRKKLYSLNEVSMWTELIDKMVIFLPHYGTKNIT